MAEFSLKDIRLSETIVADSEAVVVDLSLENTDASRKPITEVQVRLFADTDTNDLLSASGVATQNSLNIGYGENVQLSFRITVDANNYGSYAMTLKEYFAANPGVRALPLGATVSAYDAEYTSTQSRHGLGKLLNKRYQPMISLFELERATNGEASDEGLNLLATAKLSASDNEAALLQARLYYVENGSPGFALPERYTYPAAPMTGNLSQDCEVSASSIGNEDSAAFRAMDGSNASAWFSSQAATSPWIQLKMPKALYDIEITLVNRNATPANAPVGGTIYGVEADGELVQIGKFSGRDGRTAGVQSVIVCTNTARAFDTVRMRITSWNGSTWAAIGEMSVSGYDSPVSAIPACIDLTASVPELLSGVAGSSELISSAFSNGCGWCMMLWFGDEYESTRAYCTIDRAFANMHLSGADTGGVCFGGFGMSSHGNPLLESYYPACFHGGILELGEDWTMLTPLTGSTPAAYGGGRLRCRAVENKRIIAGSLLVKPGSSTIALAQLPAEFKPASSVFSLNACSGCRIARLTVHSDGDEYPGQLALSWVWDMEKGQKHTGSAIWVQCSIEYWIGLDAGSGLGNTSILGQAVLGTMILGGD